MTYDRIVAPRRRPETILSALVAEHGALRVLLALASTLVRQNRAPPRLRARDLPEHLRRDIGLSPDFRSLPRHPPFDGR